MDHPSNPADPSAPRREITVAFDGACLGNPGPGGWGVVLRNTVTGNTKALSGASDGETTNNRMELTAAIQGLASLSRPAHVTMLGDSEYVIRGWTDWLPKWKAKGWRKAGGGAVLNADLWRKLEAAVERHLSVTWTWTRGHAGHALNEQADRLASAAARQGR